MTTTGGVNTHVIGVEGTFDEAQTCVKKLYTSDDFRQKMDALDKLPASANSINFGRLAAQVVYYFSAYSDMVSSGAVRMGQTVNFVVPTGNFGNILAAYYAKQMGLPIGKLICASNRNNVLSDFFNDGIYYTHRTFFKTRSCSMDILISSNLERLLYELVDRDAKLIKTWMELQESCGSFSIGAQRLSELRKTFWGGYADDVMTTSEIHRIYERKGYLMDPHTAVASHVLEEYRKKTNDHSPAVIVATASPYKFSETVLEAILGASQTVGLDAFACADKLQEITRVPMPKQIETLGSLPIRHQTVCKMGMVEPTLLSEWRNAKKDA